MNALCQMTGISRASYYRWRVPAPRFPVAMELRDQMQQVALEFPAYGYRRITFELNRRGFAVNHKRVELKTITSTRCNAVESKFLRAFGTYLYHLWHIESRHQANKCIKLRCVYVTDRRQ